MSMYGFRRGSTLLRHYRAPVLAGLAGCSFLPQTTFQSRTFFSKRKPMEILSLGYVQSAEFFKLKRSFSTKTVPMLARNRGYDNPLQSFTSQRPPTNWGNMANNASESITPEVRAHLVRTYNFLALGIGAAAVGSGLMILTPLGAAVPFWLPLFGGFVPLLWLIFKPPADPALRAALYFSFTFIEGMALAPIIKMTATAGVLGTALVLTGAVFLGFSAAAFLAPRASLLALQGPLFGCLIGIVAISVLNMFFPTAFAHSLLLYGGLALFSVFIATDTQAMIERARCGVSDPVQDALQMFLNVVNVFVRIAEILRGMSE